ncbi:DUF4421 domain-containing protein [Phocaeicola plebeius]|uniref:DUF4421 domain-containing protein n=1 Tax=Phocaeicola plebeius TaxID=310297 RepID=UPI00216B5680|nr:DUF4421 domain-containing protein [Phocaeicola plebeius]
MAQVEKKDSVSINEPAPVASPRLSLSSLTDGIVRSIKYTGEEIKKAGAKLNTIDTTYISPNKYNLAFMLEQSSWYEHYRLGSNDGQSLNFAPNINTKLGVYFGWRWIFLGLSFDIKDLIGKGKEKAPRKEIVFNLYSAKFGVDLYYRKTGSNFKLSSYEKFNLSQSYTNTQFNGFQSNIKGLNAYWIFNHKRFSYPAAYSQSTNQRKSCGSLLAGFSYSQHNISFDHTQLPEEMQQQLSSSLKFHSLRYTDYNLSVGYGYNWVFAKNCLLNVSLLPAIAYKKARINDQPTQSGTDWAQWIKDINFDLITRAGITWNNSKYYVGASLVLHTYDYRKPSFSMTNSFGSLRIYMGFNFWKKKEYREKKE